MQSMQQKLLSWIKTGVMRSSTTRMCRHAPGSGKTTLIALKLLILARRWTSWDRGICVLTHTNVAKNEIVSRIKQSSHGERLLKYPHFIGTIQDFVNTFLAMPYARSRGWSVTLLDRKEFGDAAHRAMSAKLNTRATDLKTRKSYLLSYQYQRERFDPADLCYKFDDGALGISTKIITDLNRHVDLAGTGFDVAYLAQARARLADWGCFTYREMYEFSWQLIGENPSVIDALRARFPVALCDEMQDTQAFQEALLNRIFRWQDGIYQRFGDPDQAIFDGIGNEIANAGYNAAQLVPIRLSHRFTSAIAAKICGLSSRKLMPLETSRAVRETDSPVTIISYHATRIVDVLPEFAGIVEQLQDDERKVVKAVAGVAADPDGTRVTMASYFPSYSKTRAPGSANPQTFFEAVRCCCSASTGQSHSQYALLTNSTLRLLRLANRMHLKNGRSQHFSETTWTANLLANGRYGEFRTILTRLMLSRLPTVQEWTAISMEILNVCDVRVNDAITAFMAYSDEIPLEEAEGTKPQNTFVSQGGTNIQVGTIHSVKGETHDATLIMETSYRGLYDLSEMLSHLVDPQKACPIADPARPTTHPSIRASFLKRIYVAGTRPRHLLCLAIDSSRIDADTRVTLDNDAGFSVVDLHAME